MICTSSTWIASLKVFCKFYLLSSMSNFNHTENCFLSSFYTVAQLFCNMNILILVYSRNLFSLSIRSFNSDQDDCVWSSVQKIWFTTTESRFGTYTLVQSTSLARLKICQLNYRDKKTPKMKQNACFHQEIKHAAQPFHI